MAAFGAPAAAAGPADIACPVPAGADSISALSWSPVSNHIVASSWDGALRVWEVARGADNSATAAAARAEQRVEAPFLDATWKEDGSHVFAVGCDNAVRMWNLQTNTLTQVGAHAAPVKSCHWAKEAQYLVTGGWDRTVNVWDCRSPAAVGKIALSERIWSMDVKYPWMLVATADRKLHIYDLRNPAAPFRTMDSPVAHQTRVVRIFHDMRTFAIGTVEGRVAVRYLDPKTDTETEPGTRDRLKYSFSFRCHRHGAQNVLVYPVNCVDAHPREGYHDVFATAGSDGTFVFWNKTKKLKLKEYLHMQQRHTISATAWNATGDLYAYAASYDWHRGSDGLRDYAAAPTGIYIHSMSGEDMVGKP